MIECPSCQRKEIIGALFCSFCGAPLNYLEVSPPDTLMVEKETLLKETDQANSKSITSQPLLAPSKSVSMKILTTEQTIALEDKEEFILGRFSGNQPILPDIDLTSFQAYEAGVSRLHATIKVAHQIVTITDLGSANGTWVNDQKISAHRPFPLRDGDLISLGKFKVQVFIE